MNKTQQNIIRALLRILGSNSPANHTFYDKGEQMLGAIKMSIYLADLEDWEEIEDEIKKIAHASYILAVTRKDEAMGVQS